MLEVSVWILAVVTLVNAGVVLNGAGNPEFNLSRESAEAEIFLGRDGNGKPVVSEKLETPQREKKIYMDKRLNPLGGSTVKDRDSGSKKPWKNILEKLSDVSDAPSFEESSEVNPPLRIIVNDVVEQSEEPKEYSDFKSIREQMEIAQRWFPILLRKAINTMLHNNSKPELNELVEQLAFRTWKTEDFNVSEQKFVNWMLTRKHGESEEDSEQRLLRKRSSCCNQNECPSCQPCIVNIFNNSRIGCVVLRSDSKLPCAGCSPVDCSSLSCVNLADFSRELPSTDGLCDHPIVNNVKYISNCESPPIVTKCVTPTTTTTTKCPTSTTDASCEDPSPYDQYETSTPAPYNCKCSTPSSYKPTQPPPSSYHQSPCHREQYPHPKPIYPWYNYPDPEYRPKNSFEDHCDPYKNFAFNIPSAEIEDCSREELDYSSNYHVKRDPQNMNKDTIYKLQPQKATKHPTPQSGQYSEEDSVRLILDLPPTFQSQEVRRDSNLQSTLAKIGLSLNSERPAVVKTLESSQYSRRDRTYPARRTQQTPPKFNSDESGLFQRSY